MSPAAYQNKRQTLEQALRNKRELETGTILDLWLREQQSIKELRPSPYTLLKSQLVTRGPNSKTPSEKS